MGMGPVVATEMYNRQALNNPQPITMMQFPVAGIVLTYSASSPVTDSAAAGTALATGHKTKNGMLGMNADTVAVNSIARVLKDNGYGVGITTSVAPDDATPGAFFAHVPSRNQTYDIILQGSESGYDFIAGADLRGAKTNGTPNDLFDRIAANGVQIVRGSEGIKQITGDRVLLLNQEGGGDPNGVGYAIDEYKPGNITLPMIAQAAVDHLNRVSPDKFFLMVEGGAIDHALHANDGGGAIKEILDFNQALEIAYDFYKAHPDETLIVVTADHDTGGMSVGSRTTGYWANLDYVDEQKLSKEAFQHFCLSHLRSRSTLTWDDMKEYLTDNLGFWKKIPLTEAQEQKLEEDFYQTFERREEGEDQKTLYANFNGFVRNVFNIFNENAGFGFITTNHTGNPVPIFAVGVGAERFSHLNNNSEIPGVILDIVGLNQ